MPVHKQVTTENGIEVDEKIADLVTVLNKFDDIKTIESCQGGDGRNAFVYFTLAGEVDGWSRDINLLADKLQKQLDLCCEYSFYIQWLAGAEKPMAELNIKPEYVDVVTEGLRVVRCK